MKTNLPKALVLAGVPIVAAALFLAARLVWEQTVWTWNSGLQMVGFSLMHSGLGAILMLALYGGVLWAAAILIAMVVKRSLGGPWPVALLLAYAIAWGVVATPYGFWQRLFLDKYLPNRAGELFTYAAATGELKTVAKLLARGVDINVQGRYGTALHGAAVENNREMMAFLIEHGANVNALNTYGDSPLGYATEATPETRDFLLKHGGQYIRGSEEKRNRMIEEEVRRDIEKMDKLNKGLSK
jgi:hypothetical protein